jgi:hypothetical protein
MDPYLENPAVWSDFHSTFLMCIRSELNKILPEHYVARWDRHVWIDEPDAQPRGPLGRPDVFVTDSLGREPAAEPGSVLAAPAAATLPAVDPQGKPFLKIVDVRGRRVVTVIEMLSPANKSSGRDGDAYLAKRQEYFRSRTNLVEIDFLRSGNRPPVRGARQAAHYYIIVSRAADYPHAGIWSLGLREPLPTIPVPLGEGTDPVLLALQPCLDRAYDEARFDEDIDYHQPAAPLLPEPDATWARELIVRERGQ